MKRVHDPWIALAEEGLQCLTSAAVPGKYAVDAVGFLKYLPEWFPGAKFQREAREGRRIMRHFFRHPFETVKEGMVRPLIYNVKEFERSSFRLMARCNHLSSLRTLARRY